MNNYNLEQKRDEWAVYLDKLEHSERVGKSFYSNKDYYMACWELAKHGTIVLSREGIIIDANPYFCSKLNHHRDELIGKNIKDFLIKADDDLYDSDSININALLLGVNQQTLTDNSVISKEEQIFKCRWVATRVPADLSFPFSHCIVHVYFQASLSIEKLVASVKDQLSSIDDKVTTHITEETKENNHQNILLNIIGRPWFGWVISLIIILASVSGKLSELIHLIVN